MGLPGPLPGPQAWNPPPRPHPPASRGADPSSGPDVWPQHSSHSRCPRYPTTGTPVAPLVSEDPLSLASKAVGEAVRRGPHFRGQRLRGGLLGSSHFRGAPQTSESSCTAFHAVPQAGRRRVRPAHPLGTVCPATSLASGDGHREPLVWAARSQSGREGQRPAERVDGWLEGRGDARARGGGERAGRLTAGPAEGTEGADGPDGPGHSLRPPLHSPRVSSRDARPPSLAVEAGSEVAMVTALLGATPLRGGGVRPSVSAHRAETRRHAAVSQDPGGRTGPRTRGRGRPSTRGPAQAGRSETGAGGTPPRRH